MHIAEIHEKYFSLDDFLEHIPGKNSEELVDGDEYFTSYQEVLNDELKTSDREWLEFQAGQCEQFGKSAKSILYRIVKSSVNCSENSIAAANAITILKIMRVALSCLDLQGIQISGADLSNAILDNSHLGGAILRNVNLVNASLNDVILTNADITGVQLGLIQRLKHEKTNIALKDIKSKNILISKDIENVYVWDLVTGLIKEKVSYFSGYNMHNIACFPSGNYFITSNDSGHLIFWNVDPLKKIIELEVALIKQAPIFALSPDGKTLITCSQDKSKAQQNSSEDAIDIKKNRSVDIAFWKIDKISGDDVQCTRQMLFTETNNVKEALFSSNGRFCITVNKEENEDSSITFWDTFQYGIIRKFNVEKQIKKVSFSDDEKFLLISTSNDIYMWELKNLFQNEMVLDKKCLLVSSEEKLFNPQFISGSYNIIFIKEVRESAKFDICFWDTNKSKLLGSLTTVENFLKKFTVSQDDSALFEVSGDTVNIRSLKDVTLQFTQRVNENIFDVRFSQNNDAVCVLEIDEKNKTFHNKTYDVEKGGVINTIHPLALTSIEREVEAQEGLSCLFSQDTRYSIQRRRGLLADAEPFIILETSVQILDLENAQEVYKLKSSAYATAVSRDNKFIGLIQNRQLEIFSIQDNKAPFYVLKIDNFEDRKNFSLEFSQSFSEDGGYIAFSDQATITIWHLTLNDSKFTYDNMVQMQLATNDSRTAKMYFASDNRRLVIIQESGVIVWDFIENTQRTLNIPAYWFNERDGYDEIRQLSDGFFFDVTKDGKFLIVCKEKKKGEEDSLKIHYYGNYHIFQLWGLENGERAYTVDRNNETICTRFSNDGKIFASWRFDDKQMYVWQVAQRVFRVLWKRFQYFEAHNADIRTVIADENTKKILMYFGAKYK